MIHEPETMLLWVTNDTASAGLVRTTARELGITVEVCAPDATLAALRPGRFDVVGLEIASAALEAGLTHLREIHRQFPRVSVVAALEDSSVTTLRTALEAGATDIVSLPLTAGELAKLLLKLRQVRTRPSVARDAASEVIVIYGARGGLGTTTLAVNLASRIASLQPSVALADLDLQRGDVTTFLNLTSLESIASIAAASGDVDEIFIHGTLTRHPNGVSVLPAPQEVEEADAVGHHEVRTALRLLRAQFRWVIVDTPRTITGATAAAFEEADRILLLTDLSIPSVRASRRFLNLLERLGPGTDRVDLIITEIVPGGVDLRDATRSLGREPVATLPRDDSAAAQAMNSGTPLNGARPAPLTLAIEQLAARVTGVTQPARTRGSLFRRFFTKEATT
jgi:pilus assembly protein CpaE